MEAKYTNIRLFVAAVALFGVMSCVNDPEFEPSVERPVVQKIINSSESAIAGRMIVYVDDAQALDTGTCGLGST